MKSLMIGTIIVSVCLPFMNYEVEASLTETEELALASGSDFDRKILAQKIAAKGNLPNFLASLGTVDPDVNNLITQINNAKVAVGTIQPGDPTLANRIAAVQQVIPGISLIDGAQNIHAKVVTAIAVLDNSLNQELIGATQAVSDVVSTGGVGGNRGADILTDVTAARNALPNAGAGDLKARALAVQNTIDTAIDRIDPAQGNLPAAITSIKTALGTGPGTTLLQDADASRVQITALQGTINTATTALDTSGIHTLLDATQAVSDVVSTGGVGGNRGADILTDVTTARNALPNAGAGDLKARALAVQNTIDTAITTLDATIGQILPGATQAVSDVVSTGGVGGNRGADVLTDVTTARNALPNAGAGDLKARALAVQNTIDTAIDDIDPAKTTLTSAVESIMDTPTKYAFARAEAENVNVNYVSSTTNDASLRNEVAILFNILKTINTTTLVITHIDGSPANATNITLADIIYFLKDRVNLN